MIVTLEIRNQQPRQVHHNEGQYYCNVEEGKKSIASGIHFKEEENTKRIGNNGNKQMEKEPNGRETWKLL